MKIITLPRIAGIGTDGYMYEGNGYLLRFGIESEEQFFALQLPFIVNILGIDDRQIMHLELLGDGYTGLRQVGVCISLEDSASNSGFLEEAIDKLLEAPKIPLSDFSTLRDDDVRLRLIRFFLLAPSVAKARFLKDSAKTPRRKYDKSSNVHSRSSVKAGLSYRVSFEAGSPPSVSEWRNTLLHCYESLRRDFSPERLERLTFTAIPDSEQDYKVEAEVLLTRRPRVYKERSELRFGAGSTKKVGSVHTFEVQTVRPEENLKKPERIALEKFDELSTEERLHLWNKHLSKFFD